MDPLRHVVNSRTVAAVTALVALLALQLALGSPVGAAPVSSISGTVFSPADDPLEDMCVNAIDDDQSSLAGTRSDVDGTFQLEVPSGVQLRVQYYDCSEDPVWAAQWYPAAADFQSATAITLDEGQELTGLDATLALGGVISGTVRTTSADPVGDLCVIAVEGEGDFIRGVRDVLTEPDGSYTLSALSGGATRVLFEDCNDQGPYVEQWWDGAATFGAASVIDLDLGEVLTGVDANLQRASVINGTVTGAGGEPLSDVCVQAVGSDRLGGSTETEDDGSYSVKLTEGGSYTVQFVDCDGDPTHAGRWFGGDGDPSSAQAVEVPTEGKVSDISAQLDLGGAASLSGTVTNIRDDAMTTACVVLYLADGFVEFLPVGSDGSYSFDGFGSGTYAVAFIGCGEDGDNESQMSIPDPVEADIAYGAMWRGGQPLVLVDDEGPDPIAQGADLLTVAPGEAATVDECFGCDAISLALDADDDSVTATFTTTGVSTVGPSALASSGSGFDFALTCSSEGPGISAVPVAAEGISSPLVATGLDAGTGYNCSVEATSAGTLVAASEVLGVSTTSPSPSPTGAPVPTAAALPSSPGTAAAGASPAAPTTAAQLSFVG